MLRNLIVLLSLSTALAACTSSPTRVPQATTPSYDSERVRLLKAAATKGVLFQISEAVIRDVPIRAVSDRCRKSADGPWTERLYWTLRTIDQDPALLGKVHVIEFRRGDRPQAEISRDLDGAVSLLVLYSKVETREPIQSLSEIPCSDGDMGMIGKDVVTTDFEWPAPADILSALRSLPARPRVDRYEFDRGFTKWLAERTTIFRLTPEVAFEKTPLGEPLLSIAMAKFAQEIKARPQQPALEYWLREISQRSRLGTSIKFFGLSRDPQLSTGLHVESAGKFARRMNGYADPTYPYVSYRLEGAVYHVGRLSELGACLTAFMGSYRSPLTSMSSYDMEPEGFLFPGHSCQSATASE